MTKNDLKTFNIQGKISADCVDFVALIEFISTLQDKINCGVCLVNCFLGVSLACLRSMGQGSRAVAQTYSTVVSLSSSGEPSILYAPPREKQGV